MEGANNMKHILVAAAASAAVLALPLAAHASSYLPTQGSPNSIQHQLLQTGLDIQEFDDFGGDVAADSADDDEDEDGFDLDGDSDTIGVTATHWDASGIEGQRYEGRYQKAWRAFEGNRSRILVDVPVNVLAVDGNYAKSAALSVGLEVPVTSRWTLTPRVSAAKSWAGTYFGGDGSLYGASLSSRFHVAQLGRGDLVLGGLVGFTKSDDANGELEHSALRGGAAYQFPLKSLVFGRQASARLSYTRTQIGGDPVAIETSNEIAANLGVRLRESSTRNKFELLRIGVLHTFADDFQATTLTVGYRF